MAWTSPRTWVALETVTATQFNEQIRDNMNFLKARKLEFANAADEDQKYQDGSASVVLSAAGSGTSTETFTTAFATTPRIVTSCTFSNSYFTVGYSASTTAFTFGVRHFDNTSASATITGDYMAIG